MQREQMEERLNALLEEHRRHLTSEITRLTESYEKKLAELRLQLALNGQAEAAAPPKPPRSLPRLSWDSSRDLSEQLGAFVRDHGVHVIDLFRALDLDADDATLPADSADEFAAVPCHVRALL